jgi:hypothetical protein
VAFSVDSGTAGDFITNEAAQTISGMLSAVTVAGEVVKVSLDNGASWVTASNTVGTSGYSYSGTLTGSNTLQVRVEDAAGNAGTALSQAYVLDTAAPTLAITSDQVGTGNIAGGDIIYTFTFSEAVSGFTADEVTVANGSKGSFTEVNTSTYTLVVTPDAGFEGNVTVDVAGAVAQDSAGNASTPAAQSVQTVDMLAPTVAITDNIGGTAVGDITYTFSLSEDVTDFTVNDVTVSNGTKGVFTQVNASTYTLVVTPTAGFNGDVTVDVAGAVATPAPRPPSRCKPWMGTRRPLWPTPLPTRPSLWEEGATPTLLRPTSLTIPTPPRPTTH